LLSFIEKRHLHISDISLAQVADDYIFFINNAANYPLAKIADFLLVASTLMLIKSRAILPGLNLSPEETANADDLKKRLEHLKVAKEIAAGLKARLRNKKIYLREAPASRQIAFSPTADISLSRFRDLMNNLILALPKTETLPAAAIKKIISLEEVINDLAKRIQTAFKMNFRDFLIDKKEKASIIVSFLGMLELVKQGIIDIRQDEHFTDIKMENKQIGVPKY